MNLPADYQMTPDELRAALARAERERDEARAIVAKANNSIFGSYGYFTVCGDKDLAAAIEDLKSESRKNWHKECGELQNAMSGWAERATKAEAQLATARREAFLECAKVMCGRCSRGEPLARLRIKEWPSALGLVHNLTSDRSDVCEAAPIHRAIAAEEVKS